MACWASKCKVCVICLFVKLVLLHFPAGEKRKVTSALLFGEGQTKTRYVQCMHFYLYFFSFLQARWLK